MVQIARASLDSFSSRDQNSWQSAIPAVEILPPKSHLALYSSRKPSIISFLHGTIFGNLNILWTNDSSGLY